MHTQTSSKRGVGRPDGPRRLIAATAEPSHQEPEAIRLIAEQHAIPLDQLPRFLGGSLEDAVKLLQRLEEAGLVEHQRFLAGDSPWFWLTRRGARRAGVGTAAYVPKLSTLAHRRAVNDVRIYLATRAPKGRWERPGAVARHLDPDDYIPDAVFHVGGERHAIEVELTRKPPRRTRQIITAHSRRFDAVIYFCGPATRSLLDRLLRERRWPKLIVRELPEGE